MSSRHIPRSLVGLVRRRAGDLCEYCRLPQFSQEATFHVDHIAPRSTGGPTRADNLALACVTCSLRKASRETVPDPRTGVLVAIFHPRRDNWSKHFRWTRSWRVEGKTSTGRATVGALGINRPAAIAIRQQLVAMRLFSPEERLMLRDLASRRPSPRK